MAGHGLVIGVSVGIALLEADQSPEDLLKQADIALYDAKAERGTWRVFTPGMDEHLRHRRALETALAAALQDGGVHAALPAAAQPGGQPHHRVRGFVALAAAGRHAGAAGRLHPRRRAERPDRRYRRVGAAHRLRRGRWLADAEGCTEAQGYFISPPRPASEIAGMLTRRTAAGPGTDRRWVPCWSAIAGDQAGGGTGAEKAA